MPDVDEVRTVGDVTAKWDGSAWRVVPRTFLGTEDFTGRIREYAKPVIGTMASDLAAPLLHPVNTAESLYGAVRHPIDTVSGMLRTAGQAAQGDPQAAGHVLAAAAAPKVYDTGLAGVNRGAQAMADTPAAGRIIGMLGGMGVGGGWGGRMIGGAIGGLVGPKIGSGVARITGQLRQAVHGEPDVPFAQRPLYQQMDQLPTSGPMPEGRPNLPPLRTGATATIPATRPRMTAVDMIRVRDLMRQAGLTWEEATKYVQDARSGAARTP